MAQMLIIVTPKGLFSDREAMMDSEKWACKIYTRFHASIVYAAWPHSSFKQELMGAENEARSISPNRPQSHVHVLLL